MRADPAIVRSLLRRLLEAVKLLSSHQIVHADIKPDNILLQWRATARHHAVSDTEGQISRDSRLCIQLIDFGSAFVTDKGRYLSNPSFKGGGGGTPEYIPPEVLVPSAPPPLVRPQSSSSTSSSFSSSLRATSITTTDNSTSHHQSPQPSSFDMWSVGAVFLEVLCGFPLWFGYCSRVELKGHKEHWLKTGGLFSTKRRDPASIQQRQLQVVANLERSLQSYPAGVIHSWDAQTAEAAMDLLCRLLDPCPRTRVTPEAALLHPFVHNLA